MSSRFSADARAVAVSFTDVPIERLAGRIG
jgi:hypothetical protein